MNAAELKTLREALGLSTKWCADHVGQVSERSWKFWEEGRSQVPADVATRMGQLDAQLGVAAAQAVAQYHHAQAELGEPQQVRLRRFRTAEALWAAYADMRGLPLGYHSALLYRAKAALEQAGAVVAIEFDE